MERCECNTYEPVPKYKVGKRLYDRFWALFEFVHMSGPTKIYQLFPPNAQKTIRKVRDQFEKEYLEHVHESGDKESLEEEK